MLIILFILCGFALLTAVADFSLFLYQKKRIDHRLTAMCSLLESSLDSVHCQFDAVTESISKLRGSLNDVDAGLTKAHNDFCSKTAAYVNALAQQMEELKRVCSDLQLDYQEAQKAASRVNDFASGLANIFDYDPVAQLKKAREGGRTE